MNVKEQLINFYSKQSKHSNYQILPERLKKLLPPSDVKIQSRYEKERLKYFLQQVDFKDKRVLDIGANSGYFSFELLEHGAVNVHCYEGNREHCRFIELAAEALELSGQIRVTNDYFKFDGSFGEHYDVTLLLNVLHHLGDDYGDKKLASTKVLEQIAHQLNSLARNTDLLIFQMGFNWQGNPSKPLFTNGSKGEVIDFVKTAAKPDWHIQAIGVAEKLNGKIVYKQLNDKNIMRDDNLGEFLNRPIFIMRSKESKHE